ncbi:AAA family ATPase [bacterium]|nr:AAA family ATPase [bacterium]
MPIKSMEETVKYLKVLVYGESGVGKTWLAGSAADVEEMSPVLISDFEEGLISIRDREMDVLKVRDHHDLRELSDVIKNIGSEEVPYKTVIVDSLTELYDLNMEVQLRAEQRPNAVPELRDWLICANKMRKFLRFVRAQPMNFITICQARVLEDELTGAVSRVPDLPGKLSGQVGHYFDIVGYLSVSLDRSGETVTRTLQVQPYRRITAKDRTGEFGVAIEDPTMKKLYEAVNA